MISNTNASNSPNHKLKNNEIIKSYKYYSEKEKSNEKNINLNSEKIDAEKNGDKSCKYTENSVERTKNNMNLIVNTKYKVNLPKNDLFTNKIVVKKMNKFK